jgi:hypothetical protein
VTKPASETLRLRKKGIRMSVERIVVGEPDGRLAGRAGVEQAITTLQAQLAGMSISRSGPLREAQDLVTYPWTVGADGGPTIVSGHDVLIIRDGKVSRLYVLIDS